MLTRAGPDAATDLFGADLYLRWKPLETDQGWPFVAFQSEWLGRRYQVADGLDGAGNEHPTPQLPTPNSRSLA